MTQYNKYRNIQSTMRTNCMVCGREISDIVIDLPHLPLTEIYVENPVSDNPGHVDQSFHYCLNCGHGQLSNIVDPELLYSGTYFTRTSTSHSAKRAIDVFLGFINNHLQTEKLNCIVEIGCNDTYLLQKLKPAANMLFGIDPILKNRESEYSDEKIKLIGDYFENIEPSDISENIDLVVSSHTLEHMADPKETIKTALEKGNNNTLYIFQFPGLEPLVENARFDQVHNQHINYFSLNSVRYLLEDLNAELINYQYNYWHWGTLMIAFSLKSSHFNSRIQQKSGSSSRNMSVSYIQSQYSMFKGMMNSVNLRLSTLQSQPIYGYGAALMLPLLNYFIPEIKNFECILDEDEKKMELYYINLPLKIVNPAEVKNLRESVICVTAINSKTVIRAIISKLMQLGIRDIIIPPHII